MSNRLRVQRRTATSMPPVQDDSRVEAQEVQPPTSPAPALALAHDFATLDIASQDQLAALAGPEVQRTHLRVQPREPRFQWGAGRSVQRSTNEPEQRIRPAPETVSGNEQSQAWATAEGQPVTGSVPIQRQPDFLKVSTPGGAHAPAPEAPGPAAEGAEEAYEEYIPAATPAPAHEYATVPEEPYHEYAAPPEEPYDEYAAPPEEPYHEYATVPEEPYHAYATVPEEPYHEYATVPEEPEASAPAAEHVAPPPVPASAPGAGYAALPEAQGPAVESVTPPPASAGKRTFKLSSSPSLPPSAPAAEAPTPELSPFAKELAERAKIVGRRYANLRHRRVELRDPRQPASLPPGVDEQAKYKTRELTDKFKGKEERLAPEKWVGGKYIGQTGFIHGLSGHQAVKYLTEEQRAAHEITLNKDTNLFYWRKTGQVFNTEKMSSVGGQSKAKGRALFVMTASGKIYAANEGYEFRQGMGMGPFGARNRPQWRLGGMDPDERWRLNHSSFLAGEPVAAAGELIFDKGKLVGITDISGHYHPQVGDMRQVIQEFVAQGVDVSGVWVLLSQKVGAEGDWYVQAQDLIKYPQHNEAQFRSEKIGSPTV